MEIIFPITPDSWGLINVFTETLFQLEEVWNENTLNLNFASNFWVFEFSIMCCWIWFVCTFKLNFLESLGLFSTSLKKQDALHYPKLFRLKNKIFVSLLRSHDKIEKFQRLLPILLQLHIRTHVCRYQLVSILWSRNQDFNKKKENTNKPVNKIFAKDIW